MKQTCSKTEKLKNPCALNRPTARSQIILIRLLTPNNPNMPILTKKNEFKSCKIDI